MLISLFFEVNFDKKYVFCENVLRLFFQTRCIKPQKTPRFLLNNIHTKNAVEKR